MDVRRRKSKTLLNKQNTDAETVVEQTSLEVKNEHLTMKTVNKELQNDKLENISNDSTLKNKEDHAPDEISSKIEEQSVINISPARIKINFEIDLVSIILLLAGLVTRLYHLEEPRRIVFDELHYGKYVSLYMKRIFFFDSHPPLGKQLVSAAAYLANFDGQFSFNTIGFPYLNNVPVFALRFIPAFCGSLLIPTAYHLALEFGFRHWSCITVGLMLLFDNALLTQSRFILMESILIQFILMGLLCLMKFRKVQDRPFTFAWWIWLTLTAVNLTCALCVKYIGFYSLFLALVVIGRDYWSLLAKKHISSFVLWAHLCARFFVLFTVIVSVYLGVFYVHLSILRKAGPHDSVMTSAFQASLEGGLASITKGQPLEVTHGSQITLRHTYGRACWLHSHNQVYPLRYPDGRGSSHQQQVTCYSFKDVNNWWIIKRHDINDLVVTKPSEPIKHGDVIQLVHGITSRALNSHDIAAPMTPQSQEISCYIDYNVSMPAQNLWRVEIANRDQTGNVWHAIQSQVRLIHVNTECALKFSGRQLPEWGYNQHEVVADRIIEQSNAVWNVEEHRYTKSEDQKQRERDLINAEMIPLKATTLSFWEKFLELQMKMLFDSHEVQNSHMYSSGPLEWPLLTRGIAYWVSTKTNAQIYLLGNVVIWYTGTIAVIVYSGLLIFYLMRRRRLCYDISEAEWTKFITIGEVLLTGYFLHYLPFMFVERTLFLHHYLPAFIYKTLLTVGTIDHLYSLFRIHFKKKYLSIFKAIAIVWIALIVFVFRKFAALSYGMTPLSAKEILKLRWSETWDFIIHKS